MQCELKANTQSIMRKNEMGDKLHLKIQTTNLIILGIGFLISRIWFFLNVEDKRGLAPFGMAYLLAMFASKKNKYNYLYGACGSILGYLSVVNKITDSYMYISTIVILTAFNSFVLSKEIKKTTILNIMIILASFAIYGEIISKYEMKINLVLVTLQLLIIVPTNYIIKYSFNALNNINAKIGISTEEIISICILLCLAVAGIGNVSIANFSIRNILAFIFIFIISYVGGATYGAMLGVAMGIVVGITTNDMVVSTACYGVGGLIIGIFKDTGKIFSIMAGVMIYMILGFYSNEIDLQWVNEVLLSSIIFLAIPKSIYRSIENEINPDTKKRYLNEINLNEIKEEFSLKIAVITDAINSIANCFGEPVTDRKLSIKNRGSAIIENLADRSCSKCINREECWENNFHKTYMQFQSLINNYEDGVVKIPKELDDSCIKKSSILKNAEAIIKKYNTNEIVRQQFLDGRNILSEHMKNISVMLNRILNDFKQNVTISSELEKLIRREFNINEIEYSDVFCYTNHEGRIKIKIQSNNLNAYDYCNEIILPILNRIIKIPLSINNDENKFLMKEGIYTVTVEETPKYYVMSYAAIATKNGESKNGDYYSFGKMINGEYITILSDGMGSGVEANNQSKSTVNLVEHLAESGFDANITVNTINSIMGTKFCEDERFATLDLGRVDLYTGKISFIKIGAAPSFIKRGKKVEKINSNNLPFGLVDEVEVEVVEKKLKAGDMVISVSDGILDVDKYRIGEDAWLENYLEQSNSNPVKLSESILEKAKELSDGIVRDDMTVIVSKVYAVN